MFQIITDSSADVPEELVKKYKIRIIPLTIRLNNEEYREGVDINPSEFHEKMFNSASLPKTSQPSPQQYAEVFKELSENKAICLTISSELSGAYQSALIGKSMAKSNAAVFDTLGGSLGHGLQVLKAAELAEKGFDLGAALEKLEEYRSEMNIFILLDTLENIVKGGRLSKFQGSMAKVLNIKVLLEGIEGKVEIIEKVRGRQKFLQKVINLIGERKADFSDTVFGITHVNNEQDAEYLKEEIIKRYKPKQVLVNLMGATMSTYAGRGGIILSF